MVINHKKNNNNVKKSIKYKLYTILVDKPGCSMANIFKLYLVLKFPRLHLTLALLM